MRFDSSLITLCGLALIAIMGSGCAQQRKPQPVNELEMWVEFSPVTSRGWSDPADFTLVFHNPTTQPVQLCPLAQDITVLPCIARRDPLPELQSFIRHGSGRMPGFFVPDKDEQLVLQPGGMRRERFRSSLFRWVYFGGEGEYEFGKGEWFFRVLYKPVRPGSALYPERDESAAKVWPKPIISPMYRVRFDREPEKPSDER